MCRQYNITRQIKADVTNELAVIKQHSTKPTN